MLTSLSVSPILLLSSSRSVVVYLTTTATAVPMIPAAIRVISFGMEINTIVMVNTFLKTRLKGSICRLVGDSSVPRCAPVESPDCMTPIAFPSATAVTATQPAVLSSICQFGEFCRVDSDCVSGMIESC